MKSKEYVTIPKEEYESLLNDSLKLQCLECAGVDNWEGYSIAMEEYYKEEEKEEG